MALNFQPKFEKIIELLLYLATKKPGADVYQAVKFFYLADRAHLVRYGRPITQETYFALPYGPVASIAKDLIDRNERRMRQLAIEALPFDTEYRKRGGRYVRCLVNPHREIDRDLFSRSDLRVFDEVLEEYGDKSFDELFELTHAHEAYVKAWDMRGNARHAPMSYEDMIEDPERKAQIIEDLAPVASHFQ